MPFGAIMRIVNFVWDVLWGALIYVLVPVVLGALVAVWFWRKRRMIIGNAIGSGVIAITMIVFIVQVFAASTNANSLDPNAMLLPLGGLVALGWVDVLILFFVSGAVEERVKKRVVNPDDF